MISNKFKDFYNQLNPAQKKAVNNIEGPVMVVAGPGTGKTQVLTLRIANILLKTDIEPENILALAFSESAALNMRTRLVDIIGTPAFRVEISTFHSFCNDIIKSHPEDFPHLISSNSITELEQIEIVENIILNSDLKLLKPFGDPLYYVRSSLKAIDELKKEGVTVDKFKEAVEKQKIDFEKIEDLYHEKGSYQGEMKGKYQELERDIAKNEELLIIYKKYQKALIEQKVYDFNDMLLEALQILEENRGLLLSLQEKYHYVLIDEHQDTNTAQNKIIELLCSFHENPNLFVVGDEKQAIFRFQGASLENFLYFKTLYPEAILINLVDNYRSNQTLLDGAGSLISQNSMANVLLPEGSNLVAKAGLENELIKVAALSDYHGEYYFVAEDIQKRIDLGVSLSDIAVIARNNKDLLVLAEILEQKGINFVLDSDQNIFLDPQIKKLILFFKAIHNFGDDAAIFTALHIDCIDCTPLDVFKIMRYCQKNKTPVIEVISDQRLLRQLNLENPRRFIEFFERLKSWEKLSFNEGFESLFVAVLNDSGLLNWVLKQPNSIDILDKITGLFEDIKLQVLKRVDYSLSDFIRYLELLQKHEIVLKKSVRTFQKEAIRLLTAHKSKGLEFDFVYIINSFDGHFGNPKKRGGMFKIPWEDLGVKLKLGIDLDENERNSSTNEDERRLFYVALTRARKVAMISYSTRGLDSKEQVPSQFISEISENCKEDLDCAGFELSFLNHKEIILAPKTKTSLIQLQNKEFLNQIFLDRGLSVTALSNYLQCPWKYFYRNLLLLPDVKNKTLIFGSAIHKALSIYLKSLSYGEKKLDRLLGAYKDYLLKEPLTEKDLAELLDKGQRVLSGYFENTACKWESNLTSEMYIKGIKLSDQLYLNGMIDMIEPIRLRSGQASGVVRVYDFKTGRVKSKNQISDDSEGHYNYQQQLTFYKILIDNYQFRKWKVVEGVIDFVEPDTKGKYHREVFKITSEDVEKLKNLTQKVGEEIWNLDFWDRRCGNSKCEYCVLADMTLREQKEELLITPEVITENFEEVMDVDFTSLVATEVSELPIDPDLIGVDSPKPS